MKIWDLGRSESKFNFRRDNDFDVFNQFYNVLKLIQKVNKYVIFVIILVYGEQFRIKFNLVELSRQVCYLK